MRLARRIVAVLLVVVVAVAVAGYFYARPLLRTGTGYAAHNSCAVTLVAGRDDPDADLPDNPLVPFLTGYVNEAGGSSTSQILFTLATQKAWFTRGFGCTLAKDRPSLGEATKVVADTNPLTEAPAPEPDAEVDAAIAKAFGDDLSPAPAPTPSAPAGWSCSATASWSASATPRGSTRRPRSSAGRWARA